MSSRIERELAWKRREEEVEAKDEKIRQLLTEMKEKERKKYLELHAN